MSWFEEFKSAYADVPSQDNEGWVPDRAGFKAGFSNAWHSQQTKIYTLQNIANDQAREIEKLQEDLKRFKSSIDIQSLQPGFIVIHYDPKLIEPEDIKFSREMSRAWNEGGYSGGLVIRHGTHWKNLTDAELKTGGLQRIPRECSHRWITPEGTWTRCEICGCHATGQQELKKDK